MKGSVRYIITRPCLSEGSVRLLKYLEPVFPRDGAVTLLDDRGVQHPATVDRRAGRVYGLRPLYSGHNLGVNDVLLITALAEDRYQVECVVKPHHERASSVTSAPRPVEVPQRVVVNQSPYVREVRLERRQTPTPPPVTPSAKPAQREEAPTTDRPARVEIAATAPVAPAVPVTPTAPRHTTPAAPLASATPVSTPVSTPRGPVAMTSAAPVVTSAPRAEPAHLPEPAPRAPSPEEMLRELATLVGYRLETHGDGVARLRAELGTQSYSVLIALDLAAINRPSWRTDADYLAVLVPERERPQGLPRLTHEALVALLDYARLAPLSPLELRGYWNTGSFDLESVASVVELVSAQLSQRGVFSFVLMTLAQQPAHSVVSAARLAERLGSGVNSAELSRVLDTLTNAPFSALSPLGGGQYYLRSDVGELLRTIGEYADGLRTRLHAETRVVAR